MISPLRSLLLAGLLAVSTISVLAVRRERIINTWRPDNYKVALTLNSGLTEITRARAEISLTVLQDNVSTIDFDFGDMKVDAVTIRDQPSKFDQVPGTLNVHLAKVAGQGARITIAIDYHGRPKDGLILAPDKDGRPSATGDNWPNRVHHWIPCLDHPSAKATVTFTITAPANELVVANGKFAAVHDDSPTTRTWTYVEGVPIPAYCMVIAVGDYAKLEPTTPALGPLSYYVPKSDAGLAIKGFAPAAPSLKFFSETVAPYPYEKLALIVGATRFGGMENSSAIVFARNLLDSVTESTWADLWISEGFATYFAGLFIQKYDGEDAFRSYMKRAAERYLAYEKQTRAPVHDTETEDLMRLLNPNNYEKGCWILHMLRSRLGDEAFFRGLRIYYQAHRNATATSEDLRRALEKASGKNLKDFFARWVYGSGHPQYEIVWGPAEFSGAGGQLLITLKQTQPGDAFLDPVPIEVTSGSAKRRLWIEPTGKVFETHFRFTAKEVPTAVRLDPDDTLLKEVATSVSAKQKPDR
jgi:aminopeptidase N